METHLHWIWWFYRSPNSEGGFNDSSTIDIVAPTYKEALGRLSDLLPLSLKGGAKNGAGYNLREVIEHLPGACTGGHAH
jgi:hypothetical protein